MEEEPKLTQGDFKKDRAAEAIRKKKIKIFLIFFFSLLVLAVAVVGGVVYFRRSRSQLPGQEVANLGQQHVATTEHLAYNSNPPTSGWHFTNPAEWGVYKEEQKDEVMLHDLEHGGIWISYRPNISQDTIKKLEYFHEKWGRKIIVTPRSANDSDIAVAAWTRLDKFSEAEYSENRIENFIKAFRNKGPEYVP